MLLHVAKTAAPTALSVTGLQLGHLPGGSTLIETVVNWPGTGFLLSNAIFQRGLAPLTSGYPIFDGRQLGEDLILSDLRRSAQRVFQESCASPNRRMTIEDSIAFGPRVRGVPSAEALALAHELLARIGLTCMFISHDLNVVHFIADRIMVMYLGEVVEIGPAEALHERQAHPCTRALFAAMPSIEPDARTQAPPLTGDPPNPINPPSGCRFHTRCPFAEPLCASVSPRPMTVAGTAHRAACHMLDGASGHSRAGTACALWSRSTP